MKNVVFLLSGLLFSLVCLAQDFQVPEDLPTTKEEFISSEKDFIAAAKWLEAAPVKNSNERKQVNAWVTAWIINSPTVTVEVRESIIKPFDKNPQLLSVYMAGYTRYSLENNYSKDEMQCNIAGLKAAINCYNLGGDAKKNKELAQLVEADKNGELQKWVADALK